ncbi:conjugal transfer protein TraN [Allochromatium tepidum]|uniref:Uncharacterized protein n=1 Tax=Allochromatium tepidum TaxID=553982 RepID=A0ABM7QR62_9GAMM|nr:conjugal transfer protein TraN [Allochromatium tepidum]BCU08440.1 hypothetical protein Atep_31170 [Allochromatium tepidum]
MQQPTLSRPMRVGARFMLVWMSVVWPIQWHQAYAQGLPESTEAQLVNQRAKKLSNDWNQGQGTVRLPNLMDDNTPVRTPNLDPGPADADLAGRAADKYQPLQVGDIVQGAQRGSDFAQSLYSTSDVSNYSLDQTRVEPGVNQTSSSTVNFSEIMPVYSETDLNLINQTGATIYSDPAQAKVLSEQDRKNLSRLGCRNTQFLLLDRQDIYQAKTSPEHRILKVEFFDVHQEPIPNTNPVEYREVTTPSFYRKGQVQLQRPTLGGVAQQWWERVDNDFAIRYTYTPYTNPKNQNFFTYNHKLAYFHHGPYVVAPDSYFSSYGQPRDGFTPVINYTIPYGVGEIYISADLYRTEVTYSDPVPGQICPPDPPAVCEVDSIGGDRLRWCPGSPGANVLLMYDDGTAVSAQRQGKQYSDLIMANTASNNYINDSGVSSGVIRGLNAGSSSSGVSQEFAGFCSRETISVIEETVDNSYDNEDVEICSETLVNPYPDGCHTIKRSFGMSYLGEQNFLTVRAFNKIAEPIIDPTTGEQVKDGDGKPMFTYRKEPAAVNGPINTNFPIVGASRCNNGMGTGCSTEIKPDNPDGSSAGYYVEYDHVPLVADPYLYAVDGVYLQTGGSSSFGHYGLPTNNWTPTGSASGNGSVHDLRLVAKVYAVTINTFAGCEKYMQYAADGFCQGARLNCIDSAPTRTIGGVTFGPGLPNEGIVELLKKWGTDSSADFPDYDNGDGREPLPIGPELTLLDDKMCWEATGEPFTTCSTMGDLTNLKQFTRNGEIWATDCHITEGPDGAPLDGGSCRRVSAYDGCDSRFVGIYSGVCYNPTAAYDCGERQDRDFIVTIEEKGDSCSGVMRCLGTECHRPNLAGDNAEDFAQAAAGMEALNMMKMDMVCAETGEQPTSTSQACTPVVFGGSAMYCKIPIGNEIGLTPNCCNEAEKAATSDGPSWFDYLKATYLIYKISENNIVQQFLGTKDVYNSTAKMFGEIAKPVTNAYKSASEYVTKKFVEPLSAGFDNLFSSFGAGSGGSTAATVGVDATAKQGLISGTIDSLHQALLKGAQKILIDIGGEDFASQIITEQGGKLILTQTAQRILDTISLVFMVYSLLKLIGHIIFACKQEEYEWAMNMKWRLCTYAGDCCNKKVVILGCLEKRKLYCCYKSIAARVIAEQIIKKGLLASRSKGYRSGPGGTTLKKCDINCGGFTPYDLAEVDWAQVDLSEWLDALIESGLFNPTTPSTTYAVTTDTVPITQTVGRTNDEEGQFDQRVAATKTAEGVRENTSDMLQNTATLRQADHCYAYDDRKMPYTYPECEACSNAITKGGHSGVANWVFNENPDTGAIDIEWGSSQYGSLSAGDYHFSADLNIEDVSEINQFILEMLQYDDWLRLEINGQQILNGPYGGDMLQLCAGNMVQYQSSGGCTGSRDLNNARRYVANIDVLPYLHSGTNTFSGHVIVGGGGEFFARFRTLQTCKEWNK